MSEAEAARALEALLARIYVDAEQRARFLADPRAFALAAGLNAQQADALAGIDRAGLALTAKTFAHKRERAVRAQQSGVGLWRRLLARVR